MAWLVDTDLLSERAKRQPDPGVLKWLEDNATDLYTSSHVIGEIQAGISRLPEGPKRRALQAWLHRLVEAMEGRILNFNKRCRRMGPAGSRLQPQGLFDAHAR